MCPTLFVLHLVWYAGKRADTLVRPYTSITLSVKRVGTAAPISRSPL